MSKNLGIGKVYTYRLQNTKNVGYGYIQPLDYEKKRNIGVGSFGLSNIQSDGSEGLVIVDDNMLYVISGKSNLGPEPEERNKLVFTFGNPDTDPTTLGVEGKWTKISSNSWKYINNNPVWDELFMDKLTSDFDSDIKIEGNYDNDITSCRRLFLNCTGITEIINLNTSNVTNTASMLNGCINIESGMLDLYNSFIESGKVTSYRSTFTNAGTNTETGRIERLQIPAKWGGDYVAINPMTLRFAFSKSDSDPTTLGMTKGTWQKVSNYPNYSNVWDWTYDNYNWDQTFMNNVGGKNSYLANFTNGEDDIKILDCGDLTGVTVTRGSIYDCGMFGGTSPASRSPITEVHKLVFPNVTDASFMFCDCPNLRLVKELKFDKTTTTRGMFIACTKLTTIEDMHVADTCTNYSNTFENCFTLSEIGGNLDTSKATNLSMMFYGCRTLTTVPELNTESATSMKSMFQGCTALTSIPGTLSMINVTNTSSIFSNCTSLTDIDYIVPPRNQYLTAMPTNLTNFRGFIDLSKSLFSNTTKTTLLLIGGTNLSAESIHNIIVEAIGGTSEAYRVYVRVNSTAYNRWQLSEYYADDVSMCSQKHITITTSSTPS